MKQFRNALAFALVLTLVFALCVPALAANRYNINKYVALGDSIATGMNAEVPVPKAPTGELDETGEPVMEEYIGSNEVGYTAGVARALDLTYGDDYISYAFAGLRSNDMRYMVDDEYAKTYDVREVTVGPTFDDLHDQILADIQDADLITLNVGENDIFTIPLGLALVDVITEMAENGELEEAAENAQNGENPEDAISDVQDKLAAAGFLSKFAKALIPYCLDGYRQFRENFPVVLQKYRELNPDAQIVVLGMFNPFIALLNNELLSKLDGLDAIVTPMNLFIAATCAKYGCTFVPMTDVMIDSTVHPSNAQYQVIADRIVATLKVKGAETPFTDTQDLSEEFKTAINWAVQQGVTEGTSPTTFSPNDTCTRGQIVTFLWRMAREPAPAQPAAFTDLTEEYYRDAVAWAAENGITNGTSADKFSPDAKCTRAQIVTFLYRFDQKFNPDAKSSVFGGTSFRDVSPAAYYGAPVTWAVKNGITKGVSTVLFAPLESCTRVQAVTFLYRYAAL